MAVLIPECLSDLNRLEDELSISSTYPSADENLFQVLINSCSRHIARICNRNTFKYKSQVEYHDGTGTEWLVVNTLPIVSVTSIYDDSNRDYTAATLVDPDDYEIYHAKAGIIRSLNGDWYTSKSNLKVTFVAGYSDFKVVEGSNDQIDFQENSTDYTATVATGNYTAGTLPAAVKTALDDAGGDTYTVTYSETSHKFTVASDGDVFSLTWNTAANSRSQEFGKLIGEDISSDRTGATTYIMTYPALGIPEDLVDACNAMVRWRYEIVRERREGKFSEQRGEQSMSFDTSNVPLYLRELISPFIIRIVR
jgi:hypothetical protein